jgi:phage terminase large subunit GpA-like protein
MAHGNSHWKKYGSECVKCGSMEKLTRHHELDKNLHRTGKIIVLCRTCHQEFHYIEQQMQSRNNKIVAKLEEEIQATKHLLIEGDPFLLTRQEYLENLQNLLNVEDKVQSR